MFNNLKFLGVIILAMLLLTNCTKDEQVDNTKAPGELVFAALDGGNEKSDYDVLCDETLVIHHAKVTIDGLVYNPLTFELNGMLYTQSIKLDAGTYVLEEFILMTEDDIPVKATPMWDSEYAHFVSPSLGDPDNPVEIIITPFEKSEFDIEVLCYIPAEIDNFGFEWFEITEITILEQCFFGDICIDDFEDYAGSLYYPLTVDEVAIYKIKVFRDDVLIDVFYNTDVINDEMVFISPLCIEYANYDQEDNVFDFELWIYAYNEFDDVVDYYHYYTWTFNNFDLIVPPYDPDYPEISDGVVDFVLGDCVLDTPDLQLPIVN
jgi:hypothetical protein